MSFPDRPSTITFGALVSCLDEVVMAFYMWQNFANILMYVAAIVYAMWAISEENFNTFDLIVSRGSESMQVSASSN